MTHPPAVTPPAEVVTALAQLDELVQMFAEHPDEEVQEAVVALLRTVDVLHRGALMRLGAFLEARSLTDEVLADPHVALMFELYDSTQEADERARADVAVAAVRPQVESRGGQIEVIAAEGGVVNIRLMGPSGGGSHSAMALHGLVEEALRAELPDFVRMEVSAAPGRAAHQATVQPVFIPLSSVTRRSPPDRREGVADSGSGRCGCG